MDYLNSNYVDDPERPRHIVLRICSFFFLMILLIFAFQLQQPEYAESFLNKRPSAKSLFNWQDNNILQFKDSVVKFTHFSELAPYSSIFYLGYESNNSSTLIMVGSDQSMAYEAPHWNDDFFLTNRNSNTVLQETAKQFFSKDFITTSNIISVIVKSANNPFITKRFTNCIGNSLATRCYIAFIVKPFSTCTETSSIQTAVSCSLEGQNDPATQCVHVVGSNSLQALKDENLTASLKFCANPLKQLMEIDLLNERIFFFEDLSTSENISLFVTDNKTWTNIDKKRNCLKIYYYHDYYNDLSTCYNIPVPNGMSIDQSRPPVDIHYDQFSQTLTIFRFEGRGFLVLTTFSTINSVQVKSTFLHENLFSGWIIFTAYDTSNQILLLGDYPPYYDVIHAHNLTNMKHIRLARESWPNVFITNSNFNL